MKVNKALYLKFANNTNYATANISVPFRVRTIHFKSSTITIANPPVAGTAVYITITSDLVRNEPVTILYGDSTYSANQFNDISYDASNPLDVNGNYTFYLYAPDGSPYLTTGDDYVSMIVEFNDGAGISL